MLVSVFLPAKWVFKWYCPLRIYEAPCTWGAEDGAANLSHPCRWGCRGEIGRGGAGQQVRSLRREVGSSSQPCDLRHGLSPV